MRVVVVVVVAVAVAVAAVVVVVVVFKKTHSIFWVFFSTTHLKHMLKFDHFPLDQSR